MFPLKCHDTNITAAASAAQQQANTQLGQETLGSLKEMEKQLQSLGGAMSKVSEDVDTMQQMFMTGESVYFDNFRNALTSSLKSADQDRRLYDEAMKMNEEARKMTSGGPQRGDADFWAKAFAPTEKSAVQAQSEAMVAAFTSDPVKDRLKDIFSSNAVKSSIKNDVDDRTFGEKALDYVGLGGINKVIGWAKDRNLKKEAKADNKDQVLIKRETKEQDRLGAAYRKEMAKGDKADPKKIDALLDKYVASMNKVEEARQRREARTADPFADLMELKDGVFSKKTAESPAIPGQSRQTALPAVPGRQPAPVQQQVKTGFADTYSRVSDYIRGRNDSRADGETGTGALAGLPGKTETVSAITGDRNEPVEMAKTDGKTRKAGDAKEAADIQRKLDTQLRPDFYKEGTAFFRKYLDKDFGEKREPDGLGGLGKGAVYAAAAAAVGASVMKIGQAAALTKEFLDVSVEQRKLRNQIYEQGAESHEKMKKGWNDDMRDTAAALSRAEKDLDNTWFFDGDEKKKVEELKKKYEQELEKTRKFTAAAREKGIDVNDDKAMNKFKAEYDIEQERKAKEARAAMKAGVDANYSLGLPGQKPAAGSLEQGPAPNMVMPGSAVDTGKVETAEDQAKRIEQATYDGMKRAMMDPEIKQMNEENARATGKQINESLVGRK